MKTRLSAFTHVVTLAIGFGLGTYFLPRIVAAAPPTAAEVSAETPGSGQRFEGRLRRDLKGSDAFHWGEGRITVTATAVLHEGKLAPGPDYKLYLAPEFVEDKAAFLRIKNASLRVSNIKKYDGFTVNLPPGTDVTRYNAVVIWCERFSEFISATTYR